jgi:hypothetical protein
MVCLNKIVILITSLFLSFSAYSNWTQSELIRANTAHNAPISEQEKLVFLYVNLARLYPQKFCEFEYQNFLGVKYNQPSSMTSYQRSLKETLLYATSLVPYTYNSSMQSYAACFSAEKSRTGAMGHNRQTCPENHSAECCSYGHGDALGIVFQLLIDQDVPSLGHREIILSDRYQSMGVSMATHPKYGNCCVLDISWDSGQNLSNGQVPNISSKAEVRNVQTTSSCQGNQTQQNKSTADYQNELNELRNEVARQKQQISSLQSENSQLDSQITSLRTSQQQLQSENQRIGNQNSQLQQSQNSLKSELQLLSSRRTTVRKSKYNRDDFHPFALKMGLGVAIPYAFSKSSIEQIRPNQISPQAQLSILKNYGDSYKRNSIGIQANIGQWNSSILTDSTNFYAINGHQYLDLQALLILREWFQLGMGLQANKHYENTQFKNVLPAASLGFNFGPKAFKFSLQSSVLYVDSKTIIPRASLSFQLQL